MTRTTVSTNRIAILIATFLAAVAGSIAGATLLASDANAQLPAICEQYPNLPQCDQGPGGGGGGNQPGDDGTGPAGVQSPSAASSGGGELPFTGYPITPLLLLLLALLLTGLALRAYLAIRDRHTRPQRSAAP